MDGGLYNKVRKKINKNKKLNSFYNHTKRLMNYFLEKLELKLHYFLGLRGNLTIFLNRNKKR